MRKLTALLMVFLLVFSLAACGNTQQAEEESSEELADAGDSAVEDALLYIYNGLRWIWR